MCDTDNLQSLYYVQQHLRAVYFGTVHSRYVAEYNKPCKTRADRWNRLTSGGWGPLLEHEDIVSVFLHNECLRFTSSKAAGAMIAVS